MDMDDDPSIAVPGQGHPSIGADHLASRLQGSPGTTPRSPLSPDSRPELVPGAPRGPASGTQHGLVGRAAAENLKCTACEWATVTPGDFVVGFGTFSKIDKAASDGCFSCKAIRNLLVQIFEHPSLRRRGLDLHGKTPFGSFTINLWTAPGSFNPNPGTFADGGDSFDVQPTNSESSFRTALSWLDACSKTHPSCRSEELPLLPTRVVEVGPDVRLRETHQVRGRYATLSHRWGELNPACKTTRSTLSRNQEDIPFESLPKTFQNAIIFVRRLGIGYIWIDTLCIVQDDDEDWAAETANMSSIYQNSFLTIAATRCQSDEDSLYSSHTNVFSTQGTDFDRKPFTLYVRRPNRHFSQTLKNDEMLAEFPLLTRGWVYQERLLSSRVLHFCENELVWECRAHSVCQCRGPWPSDQTKDRLFNSPPQSSPSSSPSSSNNAEQKALVAQWHQSVRDYGALSLSSAADILVAISGIARKMNESSQRGQYLAGLWSTTLAWDLLWTRVSDGPAPSLRPSPRRAPTWSWASIASGFTYSPDPYGDYTPLVEVIDARCSPATADPTGAVKVDGGREGECYVILAGVLAPLTLWHRVESWRDDDAHQVSVSPPRLPRNRLEADAVMQFDCDVVTGGFLGNPDYVGDGETVFALRMAFYENEFRVRVDYCLLLKVCESDGDSNGDGEEGGCFERIGCVQIVGFQGSGHADHLFEGAERAVVRIV